MNSIAEGMPQIDDARRDRLEGFAPYAAPLPWFTIDILHKLYLNIFVKHNSIRDEYRIRAITCSDLLFSPAVSKVGYNVFMFRPEVQEELRGIMNPQKVILHDIGTFMLAYIAECRPHFLGLKYIESFRIEGNLILNPVAEAGRISNHIVNRLNQIRTFDQKKNTIAYYLNILQSSDLAEDQQELIRFLKGYEKFDEHADNLPDEWKTLQNKTEETQTEGITIKLPYQVRERILEEIQKAAPKANQVSSFHSLIIGINQYQDPRTFPLDGAVYDAQNISRYLNDNLSNTFSYLPTILLDNQATRSGIVSAINSICAKAEEGDVVMFYFAGYGATETAIGAAQSILEQNAMMTLPEDAPVLICHDTIPNTLNHALGISEVLFAFSRLPADCQCIFIFDCGFNRQEIKVEYKARSLAEPIIMRGPSQWIWQDEPFEVKTLDWSGYMLYASGEYQNTYESPEGGFFTRSLQDALVKNQNDIPFEDILLEAQAAAVVKGLQEPRLEPHGNFNTTQEFLCGLLKKGDNKEQRIAWARDSKADKLDLSGLKLSEIPPEVFELPLLKELNLSNNHITEIPEQIDYLLNLESLDISHNPITRIDEALGKLEHLTSLKAQDCGLKQFPYMLLKCKNVNRIDLERNNIIWAPIEIREYHPDTQVVLLGNPVLNIPEELLLSSMERFKPRFSEWQIKPAGQQPVAVLIGFDYENKLRYLNEEMSAIENMLTEAGVEVKILSNPTAEDLYRILFEHQEQMTLLHIGAYRVDKIRVGQGELREINEEVLVELFRCIRRNKFPAKLAFFNYCNSDVIIGELMPGSFAIAIGTEDTIDDRNAYTMAREFYTGLTQGQQLEESFRSVLINNSQKR